MDVIVTLGPTLGVPPMLETADRAEELTPWPSRTWNVDFIPGHRGYQLLIGGPPRQVPIAVAGPGDGPLPR